VADKGYSARTFRAYLRRRGIKAPIPERTDSRAGDGTVNGPAASTGPSTDAATSSNAASTGSTSGAASPPAIRQDTPP
jgi:hypothetical protein